MAFSIDYPQIIPGLSHDLSFIIPGLSLDIPLIKAGESKLLLLGNFLVYYFTNRIYRGARAPKNNSRDKEYSSIGRGVWKKNFYRKLLQILFFIG